MMMQLVASFSGNLVQNCTNGIMSLFVNESATFPLLRSMEDDDGSLDNWQEKEMRSMA